MQIDFPTDPAQFATHTQNGIAWLFMQHSWWGDERDFTPRVFFEDAYVESTTGLESTVICKWTGDEPVSITSVPTTDFVASAEGFADATTQSITAIGLGLVQVVFLWVGSAPLAFNVNYIPSVNKITYNLLPADLFTLDVV